MVGVLATVGILGAIVGVIVMLVRGGRGTLELAPRNLVRVYLYIASMAGIIVLVVGLSGMLTVGFAAAFGNGFIYGDASSIGLVPTCAPASNPSVKCPPGPALDLATVRDREQERRRADDLIKGITFTVFGAGFWAAHWAARRSVIGKDEGYSGLRRAYLMLGTVIFGLSTIALLPMGIYQALSYLILPATEGVYRQGAGESLSGGLVALPVWLIYLWLVVRDVRSVRVIPAPTA